MSLQDKMNVSAKPALKSLKTEVANELGLSNYEQAAFTLYYSCEITQQR